MSEQRHVDERAKSSPLQSALALLIGALLGTSVYAVAEARHTKELAERKARSSPLPAAVAVKAKPSLDVGKPVAPAPAEVETKPADPEPSEVATTPEPQDPRARALAARAAAEQALLDKAHQQLEAHDPAAAQATLNLMRKKFARGALVQERELLNIEIYRARGQLSAAKRAARKFAKAHPDSTHLGELADLNSI